MASTTRLIRFAEFEKLPKPKGGHLELYHGEAIKMPPPKHGHVRTQRALRRWLEAKAGDAGVIETEIGFQPVAEHEYWVADVVFVSRDRWKRIPDDGYLQGAPELVIEVLSQSNTVSEINEKKKLCLENGSREFWVVNRDRREIEVSRSEGRTLYTSGQSIPLFFSAGASVDVDEIFA